MGYTLKRIVNSISDYGDFKEIRDIKVIINAVENLFGVRTKTYIFDPEYGIDITKYVFDPLTPDVIDEIKDMLENALDEYVPSVKIKNIDVYKYNDKTLMIDVLLKYLHNTFTVSIQTDGTLINISSGD